MSSTTLAVAAAHALAASEAQQLGSREIETDHLVVGLAKLEDVAVLGIGQALGMDLLSQQRLENEGKDFAEILKRAGVDAAAFRRRLRALWIETHPQKETFDGHRSAETKRA